MILQVMITISSYINTKHKYNCNLYEYNLNMSNRM